MPLFSVRLYIVGFFFGFFLRDVQSGRYRMPLFSVRLYIVFFFLRDVQSGRYRTPLFIVRLYIGFFEGRTEWPLLNALVQC